MAVREIKEKEAKMGKIVNKLCNKIFVTDDNPREEKPKKLEKKLLNILKRKSF